MPFNLVEGTNRATDCIKRGDKHILDIENRTHCLHVGQSLWYSGIRVLVEGRIAKMLKGISLFQRLTMLHNKLVYII